MRKIELPTRGDLIEAAQFAGLEISENFRRSVSLETKADGTLVTAVDKSINDYLLSWSRRFDVDFIGEEGNGCMEIHDHIIYVDPLDGTGAYSRGLAGATVVITLMRKLDGESYFTPVISVIHDPLGGWTWSAEQGKGAWQGIEGGLVESGRTTISLTESSNLLITVCTWRNVPYQLDKVAQILSSTPGIDNQSFGSIALGGGLIASNFMHATVFGGNSAAETVAMGLIVTEAGGVSIDLSGKPLVVFKKIYPNTGKTDFQLPFGAIIASSNEVAQKLVRVVSDCNK